MFVLISSFSSLLAKCARLSWILSPYLGIFFATSHSLFTHFARIFARTFRLVLQNFFPTFCYNFASISPHYCPYFGPVFAHCRLNFCSNWCLVVALVCLLMTSSFQTSITIVEVSCEPDKSPFFSTTQLDVGLATSTLTKHLFRMITDLNLSLIHIWRCRRSTLCRSRWSPYH